METRYVFAIVLIVIIILGLIIKVRSRSYAIIQLISVISATLILLGYFIFEALNNNAQYPYLIFILLGIIGIFRKYVSIKNQDYN